MCSMSSVHSASLWGGDTDYVDAVIQILAEAALAGPLLPDRRWVAAMTRTSIAMGSVPPTRSMRFLLQKTQHVDLHVERHVADFIQEQGAALRRFDTADLALIGAGKRPFFIAEQFGLKQCCGNRAAIDRDKRCSLARRLMMDRQCCELFAGTGRTMNQYRCIGTCHLPDLPGEALHRHCPAHHDGIQVGRGDIVGRKLARVMHECHAPCMAQVEHEMFDIDRDGEKIE